MLDARPSSSRDSRQSWQIYVRRLSVQRQTARPFALTVNGIVGIKPTLGLLSRSGIIPIAHSQDTPGPMARTVSDAAILLGAMTGVDAQDSATRGNKKRSFSNYTKSLDRDGLQGARIGVARNMVGTNSRVLKIFEHCIEIMKHLGAVLLTLNVPNHKFGKPKGMSCPRIQSEFE
jgi:Asp-tRNA(Asn)/Glu-tRNA(Gln) amidotransferase A subunit family amidase